MGKSTEPLKTRQYVTAETLTNFFQDDTFCATCKLLNSNHLALFRVVYFVTLKMPKALIYSRIRVARPVSSVSVSAVTY